MCTAGLVSQIKHRLTSPNTLRTGSQDTTGPRDDVTHSADLACSECQVCQEETNHQTNTPAKKRIKWADDCGHPIQIFLTPEDEPSILDIIKRLQWVYYICTIVDWDGHFLCVEHNLVRFVSHMPHVLASSPQCALEYF